MSDKVEGFEAAIEKQFVTNNWTSSIFQTNESYDDLSVHDV